MINVNGPAGNANENFYNAYSTDESESLDESGEEVVQNPNPTRDEFENIGIG